MKLTDAQIGQRVNELWRTLPDGAKCRDCGVAIWKLAEAHVREEALKMTDEEMELTVAQWLHQRTDFACNIEWDSLTDDNRDTFLNQAEQLLKIVSPRTLALVEQAHKAGYKEGLAEGGKICEVVSKRAVEQARKEGMKEVVDWIDARMKHGYISHLGFEYLWQAKLKEWE